MGAESTNKSIVIADTQYLVLRGLCAIIGSNEMVCSGGTATSTYELNKVLEKGVCDLLIVDLALFGFDGAQGLVQFKQNKCPMPMVVTASEITRTEVQALSKAGIRNILLKSANEDEVWDAIHAALRGKKYYPDEVLELILEQEKPISIIDEPTKLTNAEMEIVRLISSGLTTKEIANTKHVSFHTVNTHRKNIFRKMGVTNASELIIHAIKAGWIDNIEYYI